MTTIQIRIDEETKIGAKVILEKLGLDISSAVKIFLKQVRARKGLPFLVLTENGLTVEQEDKIIKVSKEARVGKNVSKPMSPKEFLYHLDNL